MKILLYGDYYSQLLESRLMTHPNIILKKCKKKLEKSVDFFQPDIIFICDPSYNYKSDIFYHVFITNKQKERVNCLNCFVNPIDETVITKVSIMEEVIDKIIEYSMAKKIGNFDFLNPGAMDGATCARLKLNPHKSILIYKIPEGLTHVNDYYHVDHTKKVNIYLPTYYRFEKTKKSVESIQKLAKLSNYDVKIYVGDNNTQIPEMRKWLEGFETYFSEENVGKANIVNHLHRNARKCDYIFSIDSDMYAQDDDTNILDEMINLLEVELNVGVVSSNQYELSQHWYKTHITEVQGRVYKIGDSPTSIGVAGGCICLRTTDFEKIGMYKENHDIYTGDDGILMINVKRKLGKRTVISMDYGMVHPKAQDEDEEKYQEWKMKSWQRDNLKFLDENFRGENRKGFYDK